MDEFLYMDEEMEARDQSTTNDEDKANKKILLGDDEADVIYTIKKSFRK
jgi:hypothetical protein